MKCPCCLENFFTNWNCLSFAPGGDHWIEDESGTWGMRYCKCPNCKKIVIQLGRRIEEKVGPKECAINKPNSRPEMYDWILVKPKAISRTPLPPEIPEKFADDYKEACLTIADSPKASAALSRRCLQNLLREKAGTTKKDLVDQIQEVIDLKQLPSYLLEALDAVRNIGNFAAHPIKSKSTGEIVEVETGEAEWNLDILEQLFDFYFVQLEILRKKREKLNQKLKDAGKPPMK